MNQGARTVSQSRAGERSSSPTRLHRISAHDEEEEDHLRRLPVALRHLPAYRSSDWRPLLFHHGRSLSQCDHLDSMMSSPLPAGLLH